MAVLTNQQARVVDPVLTKLMLGYTPANLAYLDLFPEVPVNRRGGKVVVWDKDNMEYTNTTRVIGNPVAQEQYAYSSQSYSLDEHNLDAVIPMELDQEAREPSIDLVESHLRIVKQKMGNEKEVASATIALNTANYSAGNKVTHLAGAGWNGTGNPVTDGLDAVGAIEDATGGVRPTVAILSTSAFRGCQQNTNVLAQVQYTGVAPTTANVTPKMLASMWGIDKVVVANHSYWNGANMVKTWSDDAVFAYTDLGAKSNLVPSFGFTYQLRGYPFVSKQWWENSNRSYIRGYNDSYKQVIAMADSGYLITGAGL